MTRELSNCNFTEFEEPLPYLPLSMDLQFFAKDGPGGEKTEEPTTKKLDEARKEGQVAKSREISMATGLLAMFLSLRIFLDYVGEGFFNIFYDIFGHMPEAARQKAFTGYDAAMFINYALERVVMICLPFMAIAFVVAFVSSIVQVGWKVTTKPMQPKFSKMNPLSGFKRIFSKDTLFELLKSILKIGIISIIAYSYLAGKIGDIFLMYNVPVNQAVADVGDAVIETGIRISVVYFLVAALDFVYQKHKFHEDMKMTKQEVKDEMKNSEGDPHIKGQQRQRMQQASRRRMMNAVPQADVVITNPTHYAVALEYKLDTGMTAPKVLAKGKDYVAQKIKEIAAENNVEIVEDKPLARALYANVEVGEDIPPELYEAVANILVAVYKKKNAA